DHRAERARIEFVCGIILRLQPEDVLEVEQAWRLEVVAEARDGKDAESAHLFWVRLGRKQPCRGGERRSRRARLRGEAEQTFCEFATGVRAEQEAARPRGKSFAGAARREECEASVCAAAHPDGVQRVLIAGKT